MNVKGMVSGRMEFCFLAKQMIKSGLAWSDRKCSSPPLLGHLGRLRPWRLC